MNLSLKLNLWKDWNQKCQPIQLSHKLILYECVILNPNVLIFKMWPWKLKPCEKIWWMKWLLTKVIRDLEWTLDLGYKILFYSKDKAKNFPINKFGFCCWIGGFFTRNEVSLYHIFPIIHSRAKICEFCKSMLEWKETGCETQKMR